MNRANGPRRGGFDVGGEVFRQGAVRRGVISYRERFPGHDYEQIREKTRVVNLKQEGEKAGLSGIYVPLLR